MIGILAPAVCRVESAYGFFVEGSNSDTLPIPLVEPAINRGGIGVDDGGTWRLIAPRSGLYRVTIERVQATGYEDDGGAPGQASNAEFHVTAALGAAFVRLTYLPMGVGGGGATGYEYSVGSASAIMELEAGQELVPEFGGSGASGTDPAAAWLEVTGVYSVELVRRV